MRTQALMKLLSTGVAIAFLMAWVVLAAQGQGNPKKIKKLIHLTASQVDPGANGIAKIMLKTKGNAIQRFQVVGANLKAGTAYTLVVDGNAIATKTAASEHSDADPSGGAVEFIYFRDANGDNEEGSQPLPATLDPVTNIKHVELRDDKNQVVLSGDFSQ